MSVTAVPIRPIKRGSLVKLWLALALLAIIAAAIAWAGTGGQQKLTTASGLQFQTLTAGSGAAIGPNDGVIVEYEGRLTDGTVFDSTEGKGPAPMLVAQVVPGFSEALQLMQSGGEYRIWLPPELGYGSQVPPGGPIPPNATLEFDVKVVQVVPDAALQVGAPPPGM